MTHKVLAIALAAALLGAPVAAQADNQMGYTLLSADEASTLPHNHGGLGLSVQRSQQITDGGMTFDIMRVSQVRPGSPGAQAGLKPGDQLIAVDGRVFASLAAFAAYIGSLPPGQHAAVDYIPAGGGPAQAQRVGVMIAPLPGQQPAPPPSGGLSTGTKVAIGVGAAALIGCYKMGCFSHRSTTPYANQQQQGPARQ